MNPQDDTLRKDLTAGGITVTGIPYKEQPGGGALYKRGTLLRVSELIAIARQQGLKTIPYEEGPQ